MSFFSYKRIDVTRRCTASCSHCNEYSLQEDLWTELDQLKFRTQLQLDPAETVYLLTGAEPFEAPRRLRAIVKELEASQRYFRMATGGHVDLQPFHAEILSSEQCVGISLGTDVIHPQRNQRAELRILWESNLEWIRSNQLPYSLTVSVLREDSAKPLTHIVGYLDGMEEKALPSFIMLIGNEQTLETIEINSAVISDAKFFREEQILKCAI